MGGGLSQRQACRLLEWNRTTFRYQPRPDKNAALRAQLHTFANTRRRRGSVKAWNWLGRQGHKIGRNRVPRLWKQERLQVKKRSGQKKKPPDKRTSVPLVALYPGHVWSYDFLFDATNNGTRLKMLTIGDDFTRECLAIEVATSLPSQKVIAVLSRLVAVQGAPAYLRSDNGSEFIAHALKAWLAGQQTKTHYIIRDAPGRTGSERVFTASLAMGSCTAHSLPA